MMQNSTVMESFMCPDNDNPGQHTSGPYFNLHQPLDGAYVVGKVGQCNAKFVRIVHISDTHGNHCDFLDNIPNGHILIHSGDFGDYRFKKRFCKERERDRQLHRMQHFFSQLPHRYKIFVPGNEDFTLETLSPFEIQQRLPNVIYLHDNSCTLFGLKIYGTPWSVMSCRSMATGFCRRRGFVEKKWTNIPSDTDILISHMTPWKHDKLYGHVTKKVRPIVHLFGDESEGPGITLKEKVLFSNGAMYGRQYVSSSASASNCSQSMRSTPQTEQRYINLHASDHQRPRPIVIDVYVVTDQPGYVDLPVYEDPRLHTSSSGYTSSGNRSRSSIGTSYSDKVESRQNKECLNDSETTGTTMQQQQQARLRSSSTLPPIPLHPKSLSSSFISRTQQSTSRERCTIS